MYKYWRPLNASLLREEQHYEKVLLEALAMSREQNTNDWSEMIWLVNEKVTWNPLDRMVISTAEKKALKIYIKPKGCTSNIIDVFIKIGNPDLQVFAANSVSSITIG